MKYFLYARCSTEDKKKQIQSIPDQIEALKQLALQHGYKVVDVITDEKSAKAPGRKGFTDMIKRIGEGEANGILCWELNRLARNMIEGGSIIWMLQHGTISQIITPHSSYDVETDTILLSVEFGAATQFSKKLRRDVERGMNSKIKQGWYPSKAPVGYLNESYRDKGLRTIIIDPISFVTVQHLWQYILKEKSSLTEVYKYMKQESPIYINNKLIAYSTFHRLFQNIFYCGLFKWKGELHEGLHTPMITQAEYEEVQRILKTKKCLRQGSLQFDLKGIFACGTCKSHITAERHIKHIKSTGKTTVYNYYKCPRHKTAVVCKEKTLSESKIEQSILHEIEKINIPEEIIKFGLEQLKVMKNERRESTKQKKLEQEIKIIELKIQKMQKNIIEEDDTDIRKIIHKGLNEQKIKLKGLQEQHKDEIQKQNNPHHDVITKLQQVRTAKSMFLNGDKQQKKSVLNLLGSNWTISNQSVNYKPHTVITGLICARKSLVRVFPTFEPDENQSPTSKSLTINSIKSIWYPGLDSNQ